MFDSNGVNLFYRDEGTGQPVVLIHGYLANHDNQWFRPKIAEALLAKGYRVVALDSRGHGQSGKPLGEDNYGAEMSEDLVRLLKHPNSSVRPCHAGVTVARRATPDRPSESHAARGSRQTSCLSERSVR